MKTKLVTVFALSAVLLAANGFAQGKGGGGGGGGGPGGGGAHGGGFGNGASNGHGQGGWRSADALPGDKPGKPDKPSVGRDDASAKPNGRSAKPAAQELAGSMRDINQTAFAQRKELHDTLDMRLKSSRDALKQIQTDAKELRGAARDEFKASLDVVKARERDLESALKATRKSTEATWEKDRGVLDRAYRDFNDAFGRLPSLPKPPTPKL